MTGSDVRTGRILIVGECVSNVCLLENILSRLGYNNLKSVMGSREAVAQVEQFCPDLILLETLHSDGFEVMKQLVAVIHRETYLPVLVLSGDVTVATRRKVL